MLANIICGLQIHSSAHGVILNQEISIKVLSFEPLDQFKKSMLPSKLQVLTLEEQSTSKMLSISPSLSYIYS